MRSSESIIRRFFAIIAFFLILGAGASQAHELTPAIINLHLSAEQNPKLDIELNLESAIAEIGVGHEDTDESPNADRYNALRALPIDQMHQQAESLLERLPDLVQFYDGDGNPVATRFQLTDIDTTEVDDLDQARDTRISFALEFEPIPTQLSFQWPERFGETIFRVNDSGEVIAAHFLQPGDLSDQVDLSSTVQQSQGFLAYIIIGFEHILPLGLDHILFVIGIYLLSQRLSDLLWQVSAFTLAHTLTLAMATLGWVSVPGSIVEPLIAASISYVAIENLFRHQINRGRIALVFGFGLLHGLGFAGVLSEIGLDPNAFVSSLIAFNIGVELGQLTVIGLMYLLLGRWLGKTVYWENWVRIPISVLIALVGIYWVIERVFF